MLSLTTTGNLRRWTTQTLPATGGLVQTSAHYAEHFALSGSSSRRSRTLTLPVVFCRFRNITKTYKVDRKRYEEGRAAASYFCSQEYNRGYRPREVGGGEFTGHRREVGGGEYVVRQKKDNQNESDSWEDAAIKDALKRFKRPNVMQMHLESLGTPNDKTTELINHFSAKVLQGEIPEVSKMVIRSLADDSLEVGMTFQAMGTTREMAIASKLDKTLVASDCTIDEETHGALKRLEEAGSGAYLSPLRLLAHEVYSTLNKRGVPCNLVTGEERRYAVVDENGTPDPHAAKVVSSTVEMANFDRKVDIAVIDEIQMLADAERGWAWTHALLGLPAQEVHLCGEPTVVELVKKICALANEEVEVKEYKRLSKLEMQPESLYGDLRKIERGDCVVTFSRKSIFATKNAIEAVSGLRCAVAYGSLPPESRNAQAELFNDAKSGYDVLVASDAIGMGLNLNIRRIIFEAVRKFDGTALRVLSLTQLKQIAGRAGRFGTEYAVGQATTLVQADISILKRAMAIGMIEIKRAAIQPTSDMLVQFAVHLPNAPFSYVLEIFDKMSRNSTLFFPGQIRAMVDVAKILDKVEMSIQERITFISAPINLRDDHVVTEAKKMAKAVSIGKHAPIDDFVKLPEDSQQLDKRLQFLESSHRTIMLYLWLSQRFSNVLEGGVDSDANTRKIRCEELIKKALEQGDNRRTERMGFEGKKLSRQEAAVARALMRS
ncbi:RNA helicase [Modicella reniformis]|uniref:RNA helicase n=1 Tax=Modicella reniformis TaxID=1440133 RepID=A0A9P6LZQ4_9FUNG|nr:RNA helicase [Modicella reniformis]